MKKLLLSFLMCILAVVGMRAAEGTITFKTSNSDSSSAASTSNFVSGQIASSDFDGLTCTATNNCYGGIKGLKLSSSSKNVSFTLKLSETLNVKSIAIKAMRWKSSEAATIKVNNATAKNLTADMADYIFDVNAEINSIKVDVTKRVYISSITIVYDDGEGGESNPSEVDTPTFNPAAGEVKAGTVVTISTNSGSTLKYTVNGVANTSDDNKAYVTINEETTIEATATAADGVTVSESATAVYTIKAIPTYANIAALVESAIKDEDVILSGTVTVTHDAGNNLYVTDATGSLMIFGTSGNYKNGDRLTGIRGTYSPYNGLPEIVDATLPATEAGEAVAPVVMTAAEVSALTNTQYSRYIKMENVTISNVSSKNATLTDASGTVALYNQFALGTDVFKNGENLTIIAVIGYYNKLQVQPITIEENEQPGEGGGDEPVEPEKPEANSWTLVTDASMLKEGDQIVIAAANSNYAISTEQKSNNRGQAAVTKDGNTIAFGEDTQIMTIAAGKVDGTWAFNTGAGYLYAASSSSNYLRTQSTLDANGSWAITIDGGAASIIAQGSNTRNVMLYNQTSGLFACYASASQQTQPVAIYRYEDGSFDENITAGAYYLNPGIWENNDCALYAIEFVNKNTAKTAWVQGFLSNHFVTFELVEGAYTHMTFHRIKNSSANTAQQITDWTAIETLNKTAELTYTPVAENMIQYYNITATELNTQVSTGEWVAVVGTGLDRVESINGIGYAYGVVSAEGTIEVYNLNGAVVARGNDNIDLRGLNRGVYIVRNGNQVRKVVR